MRPAGVCSVLETTRRRGLGRPTTEALVESALQQEFDTCEAHKAALLKAVEGKWVLIKGERILGIFATQLEAIREGWKRLGRQEFLVEEIPPSDGCTSFRPS